MCVCVCGGDLHGVLLTRESMLKKYIYYLSLIKIKLVNPFDF